MAALVFELNCSLKERLQIRLMVAFIPIVWLTHAGHGLQISRYHVGDMSARSGLNVDATRHNLAVALRLLARHQGLTNMKFKDFFDKNIALL